MEYLEYFINHYGYLAIFIGCFLEGETILLVGGFTAHRGFLELHWVIGIAFLGTFAGDQLYFQIGRLKGTVLLKKIPHWQARMRKVNSLLVRYRYGIILGFRFLYGIRTVTPFILGMTTIPSLEFLLLNGIGGIVWAVVVGSLGYAFGEAIELFIGNVKSYELKLIVALFFIGVILHYLISVYNRKP